MINIGVVSERSFHRAPKGRIVLSRNSYREKYLRKYRENYRKCCEQELYYRNIVIRLPTLRDQILSRQEKFEF